MTALLVFRHCGLTGAIPADQAFGVESAQTPHEKARLWRGTADEAGRGVSVRSAEGTLCVMCESIALRDVARSELRSLSPCLRGALAQLPHVVGIAFLENGPTWLVDMSRYRGPNP